MHFLPLVCRAGGSHTCCFTVFIAFFIWQVAAPVPIAELQPIFDPVQAELLELLTRNALPRFYRSPLVLSSASLSIFRFDSAFLPSPVFVTPPPFSPSSDSLLKALPFCCRT